MRLKTMVFGLTVAALTLLVGATTAGAAPFPPKYFPDLDQDMEVSTAAAPASTPVGSYALLSSIVTNRAGFGGETIFNDTVPDGLAISSVAAGAGVCTTSGQAIACKIILGPGESAPVNVVVTTTTPGSYSNKVSVAPAGIQHDPNPSNDSASATFTVTAAPKLAPTPTCTVPSLNRTPLPVAKRVLGLLHCKAGKAKRVRSRAAAKGQVIRTTPKPGTYKQGKVVSLVVSSGPPQGKRRGR